MVMLMIYYMIKRKEVDHIERKEKRETFKERGKEET